MSATLLTDEQLEIRALAREFAAGEIRPHTAAWDEARALDEGIFAKLGELGFLGMLVPETYGGLELDPLTYLLVIEELAWGDASVALAVAVQSYPWARILVRYGSDEQKETWLPRLASGEVIGAFALSEPDAGSDAASLRTRAERDGDGWRLSGTKRWVTNGQRAGLALVFARTSEGNGGHGIGVFLVEPSTEGYRVTGRETTMGVRASETVTVSLEDVRVGADALVGDASRGFQYAMETLDMGRCSIAAQALGIARAAYEHAVGYALEREQFGQAIAGFGAIRDKLAEMARRIEAARALTHAAIRRLHATDAPAGPSATAMAAMAKITASEAAMWVSDEAVQVFGGYGYMRDYPVEKLMRDAKGTEIYEGTSEILRLVIGRELLRDVRGS
ncbi:MAG: acyl-CoA dehydrogenase family protein [Gemmatimonadetes bacterium]|nr:acyl-CoA dehydrogenase family protein [Gemmatimonadota bacterium]